MKKLIDIARRALRVMLWCCFAAAALAVVASILTFNIFTGVPAVTISFVCWKIIHLLETQQERIERKALAVNERLELSDLRDLRQYELSLMRMYNTELKNKQVADRISTLRDIDDKIATRAKELRAASLNS